ncbi:MAG: inositol monophosphatase family protein [Myxococcaceae bacterium]
MSDRMKNEDLLEVALEAARAGGSVLSDLLRRERKIAYKGKGRANLVTDADHASEKAILEVLQRRVPKHRVLAEESGEKQSESDYVWFVDPLDGTTNYAHGVPHFSVTLAVEGPAEDGTRQVLAGVVRDPVRGEVFAAARGQGATLDGEKIQVSDTTTLDRALLCTGFPYDLPTNWVAPLGLFNTIVKQAQGMRRMGSAALDISYLACGRFDGFWEFNLRPWDYAAATLLVQEAGGKVGRVDGGPFHVRVGHVLCSCPGLWDTLAKQSKEFLTSVNYSYEKGR